MQTTVLFKKIICKQQQQHNFKWDMSKLANTALRTIVHGTGVPWTSSGVLIAFLAPGQNSFLLPDSFPVGQMDLITRDSKSL